MNKSWEGKIKEKLAHYEESAPDLSWAELDKVLQQRQRQQHTQIVSLWGKRISVAAAIAATIVGTTTVLLHQQSEDQQEATATVSKPTSVATQMATPKQLAQNIKSSVVNERQTIQEEKKDKQNINQNAKKTVTEVEENSTLHQEVLPSHNEEQKEETTQDQTAQISHEPRIHQYRNLFDDESLELGRHTQTKLSVTTYVAGNMGQSVGEEISNFSTSLLSSKGGPMLAPGKPLERHDVHHRSPIRIGLGINYSLSPRWSITTGIAYTYLHSDLYDAVGSNATVAQQKLHYLGIPLQVNYTLWNNKNINVYVSGGGMAEKMIKGTADIQASNNGNITSETSETVKMHPLQWSVSGAAGIEYIFYRQLSVYAEPGVTYYFDNGSPVETIYDDKPCQFSLNLGLRFNIK